MFPVPLPVNVPAKPVDTATGSKQPLTSQPPLHAKMMRVTDPQREFAGFSLNVVLTTILFIVIFITASSWTLAVNKEFEHKKNTLNYWMFSLVMTLVTIGLSIGFGELAHAVNQKVDITITNLLGTVLE